MRKVMIVFAVICMLFSGSTSVNAFDGNPVVKENVKNGWSADGQMYYRNGKYVTGQQTIGGFNYYFDEKTGKMVHGWKYLSDKKITVWYGQETGHMLYGEYRINMKWYYLDDKTGGITYGWKQIKSNGKTITVYYDKNGWKVFGKQTIGGKSYEFNNTDGALIKGTDPFKPQSSSPSTPSSGTKKKGWVKTGSSYVYYDANGKMLKGEQTIRGYQYYFNPTTGLMKKGWRKKSGSYVFYNYKGCMVFGEQTIRGKHYYFNEKTGLMLRGWRQKGNSSVYYNYKGVMLLGEQTIDGKHYFFNEKTGLMKKGWRKKSGTYVYYNSKGVMVYGEQTINGHHYYFNETTGLMKKGWRKKSGSYVYYNSKGCMVFGEQTINGKNYYFLESSGLMKKGWRKKNDTYVYYNYKGCMVYGEQTINGKNYYFLESSGLMKKGWRQKDGTYVYYNAKGVMVYGEQTINGKKYYFNESTGLMTKGWREVGDSFVYYDDKGCMVFGEQTIGQFKCVFDEKTGLLISKTPLLGSSDIRNGWSEDGQMYYKNGSCVTGQITIGGYRYYFDENTGKMVHGWKYIESEDKTVWYGAETGHMLFGEYRIDGHYYYLDKVTGGITYGWKTLNGKKLYFDDNGWKSLGMQRINGKWHQFDSSTGNYIGAASGWKWESSKLVFYDARGKLCKGTMNINHVSYQFDSSTGAVVNKGAVTTVFDAHTNAIINAHRYDFNSATMKGILKSYGGYDEYVKSLGGVFTKYNPEKTYKVTTKAQFREVAKYVWGLLTIYGVDYYGAVYGKDSCWGGAYPADDAFYQDASSIAAIKGKYNPERATIDYVLAGNTSAGMQVNCTQGLTYILRKAGLIDDDAPTVESEFYYYKTGDSKDWTHYYRNHGAKITKDGKNLQVGDVIAFFKGTSYKHVVMVMDVNESAGTYTLYDSGHILTTSRTGIRTLKIGNSPASMFGSYNSWAALRLPLNLK